MFAPKAFALSRRLGWPHSQREWEIMEGLGELYVLGNDERLWATSLITNVSANWFNIGMVLVDPDFRKRGSGSLITKISMSDSLTEGNIVSLTSSLVAERVYRNLDFIEIASMHDLQREPMPNGAVRAQSRCRDMRAEDMPKILALEHQWLAVDRQTILTAWNAFAQQRVVVEEKGEIVGYGCMIERGSGPSRYGVICPLVARDIEAAKSIVGHIAETYPHRIEIFVIDVPTDAAINSSRAVLMGFLDGLGFRKKQVLPIMTWQGHPLPAYRAAENWCPVSLALG